jgi:hypothetical protein
MGEQRIAIHAKDADRKTSVRALCNYFAKAGYTRVEDPRNETGVESVYIVSQGPWQTIVLREYDAPSSLAKSLSRTLKKEVLWLHWTEDESNVQAVFYQDGSKRGELNLPQDAKLEGRQKIRVPLRALSSLVPGASGQVEIRIPVEEGEAYEVEPGHIYIGEGTVTRLLRRAFGFQEVFFAPEEIADRVDAPSRIELHFVSRAAQRAEARASNQTLRAACDARTYTVGWFAFQASARTVAPLLERTARVLLLDVFAPWLEHMPVFATQRQGNGVIPMLAWPDAQEVWDMCIAKTLRTEGAAINLQTGTPVTACIWSHFRENTLSVGFSFRSLENATKRHEIARKLEALFSSALEEKCVGAIIAAQATPISMTNQALAWEYLRGRSQLALQPAWWRSHARGPGWRLFVPKAATRPSGPAPAGFTIQEATRGFVVGSTAPDPHAMQPAMADALELWLEPTLGTHNGSL